MEYTNKDLHCPSGGGDADWDFLFGGGRGEIGSLGDPGCLTGSDHLRRSQMMSCCKEK